MMSPTTPTSPQNNFTDTLEKPCVGHQDTFSAQYDRVHELPAEDGLYQDAESSPRPASPPSVHHLPDGLFAPVAGAREALYTHVPRAVLESMTHFPRAQAAATLGLCNTTFKKVCRRSGMLKWPYRRRSVGGSDTTGTNTSKHTDSPSPAPSTTPTSSAAVSYWGATEDPNFLTAILDYLDAFDAPSPPQIPSDSTSRGLAGPGEAPTSGVVGLSEGDVFAIVGIEPDSLVHAVGGEGWLL